jgi:methanogenic corrinoid protein MtbC1
MAGFPSLLDNAFKGWIKRDVPAQKDYRNTTSLLKIVPQSSPASRSAPHDAELAKMVETEIVPRLMLVHRAAPGAAVAPEAVGSDQTLGPETTESFAMLALSKDPESLIAFVGTLLQSGLKMETIYTDLMMPAARRLGEYWDEDAISFTDVTIGLSRLQQVVRTMGWKRDHGEGPDHSSPSALFATVCSEQHTLALFIIDDVFRRAGWRTWIETSGFDDDLIEMVRCHWFDIVGLSASCEADPERIESTIAAIRSASRNPSLFILVGGRLFADSPDLVSAVGADATAPDGGGALLIADKAVSRLAIGA